MPSRPNSNEKRPMSRRQYEAYRRRRQQNMRVIAIMAAVALVIIAAVVLILIPKAPKDDVVPVAAATPKVEAAPEVTLDPSQTPVPELPEAISEVGETVPLGDGLRSVRMRVVGDIMMCYSQLVYARDSGYDFHNQFENIAYLLKNADYTMGNMEGTVGKYKNMDYSGYPQFNCPDVVLAALKDSGFDFLTLANNHMLDRWFDGLKNTVNWVEQYGFDHVGAYRTREERNAPVVYEVGGIKFGFVAYTHSTNSIERLAKGLDPGATEYGVPYIQKADIAGDIQKLREAGAEVVIAFPHWGEEFLRAPDDTQRQYARRLAEAGVDIILGSHAHMVQPMEFQRVTAGETERQVLTAYCMGNFISDHTLRYTDNGMILDFTVSEQPDGRFTCDCVGYIPTFTWKQDGLVRVLSSAEYLEKRPYGMDDANYGRMVEGHCEINEVLGDDFRLIDE